MPNTSFVLNPQSTTLDAVRSNDDLDSRYVNISGDTMTGALTLFDNTVRTLNYTLTIPATGTAALLGTANTFTAANTFNDYIYVASGLPANKISIGAVTSVYAGVWLAQPIPDLTNYLFLGSATETLVNAPTTLYLKAENTNIITITTSLVTVTKQSLFLDLVTIANNKSLQWRDTGATARVVLALASDNNVYLTAEPAAGGIIFRTGGFSQRGQITSTGLWGIGATSITPATRVHIFDSTTTNNAIREAVRIQTLVSTASTGGANGFGVGQSFYAETATDGTYQQQGYITTSWVDATNATRKARLSLSAYDTAARLGLEIEADGTASKSTFYGTLTTNGRRQKVTTTAIDYTALTTDEVIVVTATATITLPAATGTGQTYRIVCRAGTTTIDANSSETIKGELTQTLYENDDLILTDTATGIWE